MSLTGVSLGRPLASGSSLRFARRGKYGARGGTMQTGGTDVGMISMRTRTRVVEVDARIQLPFGLSRTATEWLEKEMLDARYHGTQYGGETQGICV